MRRKTLLATALIIATAGSLPAAATDLTLVLDNRSIYNLDLDSKGGRVASIPGQIKKGSSGNIVFEPKSGSDEGGRGYFKYKADNAASSSTYCEITFKVDEGGGDGACEPSFTYSTSRNSCVVNFVRSSHDGCTRTFKFTIR